jgi:hypothetical protein
MGEVLLSKFEMWFFDRVSNGDKDLLEILRHYSRLRTYWEDLLIRCRASLVVSTAQSAVGSRNRDGAGGRP